MGVVSSRKAFAPRRFSWAYPLLVTAIALPVVCVVWLLQKAIDSERAVVRQLVVEARERTLDDAEKALEARFEERVDSAYRMGLQEHAHAMIPALREVVKRGIADSFVYWGEGTPHADKRETGRARAMVGRIRTILERSDENRLSSLEEGLDDPELGSAQLAGGRSAWLLAFSLVLDYYETRGAIPEAIVERLDGVFEGRWATNASRSQLAYLMKRFGKRVTSEDAREVMDALSLSMRWSETRQSDRARSEVGLWQVAEGLVGIDNAERTLTVLFRESGFLERASNDVPGIAVIVSGTGEDGDYALVRPMQVPLESFSLAVQADGSSGVPREGESRIGLYVWIGGIVLLLSAVSGVTIVVLMRRQSGAAQLKNDLVATVTHELKTPVASIRLLVDTLRNPERSEKVNTGEYLSLIDKENRRLGRLIDDFLSFSRMERNKSNFSLEEIDPVSVVETSEEAFRERFSGSRFSLEVQVADGMPAIAGDEEALATALGNLLENALKYGGRPPLITLRLEAQSDGVCFTVKDDGPGIPRREQRKVFRRFYQGSRKLSSHSGGVGLGLSIVSFIVAEHGGQVSLESEEGAGSVFSIMIPYA